MFQTWDCGFVSHSFHMGFMMDKTESGELLLGLLLFPFVTNFIPSFLHTHFISPAPAMLCQAWSADLLAIYSPSINVASSHLIPWPDRSRFEDIYFIFYRKVSLWYLCTLCICVFQAKFLLQDHSVLKEMLYIFPAERVWNKGLWMSWKLVLLYFSNIFFILC